MARRTTRQFLNLVLRHETRSKRLLILCYVRRVEHLLAWADVLLRGAVAAEAPFHRQRGGLVGQGHLVDAAVAVRAADALAHVNAVVEVDEVGEAVDARPDQPRTTPGPVARRR